MTAAWGEDAEPEPEGDADGTVAVEDAYPAASEADGPGPVARPAAGAEDPLDAELSALQQQLQILEKLCCNDCHIVRSFG